MADVCDFDHKHCPWPNSAARKIVLFVKFRDAVYKEDEVNLFPLFVSSLASKSLPASNL